MALYTLLTTALTVILFVGVILLFRKIPISKGKRVLVVVALLVFVFGASMLLYYLPSFETMEDALAYGNGGDILLSAEADKSAALLSRKNANDTTTTLLFFAKKDGCYKLRTATAHETILRETTERGTVQVFHVKKTDDFYLFVTGLTDWEYAITDSNGKQFQPIFEEKTEGRQYVVRCLEVVDFSEDYTVYLGDLAVNLSTPKD